MVGLLSLAVGAETQWMIFVGVLLKHKISPNKFNAANTFIFVLAFQTIAPAGSVNRVNRRQLIKHPLHDGSSHPITTKALSGFIRIN
jgi:hypothetical protein